MEKAIRVFWDTLKLFQDNGLLKHLIVVGSWAEYIYECAYYKDYEANLKTQDVDFLVKNINYPRTPVNVSKLLEDNGFVMATDYITGTTKFFKEPLLELEFLVMEKGRGKAEPYSIKPLGIRAEGLRHMHMLVSNCVSVYVKEYDLDVQVPLPQALVLHKMVISKYRKGYKKEKDLGSILNILDYLGKDITELRVLQQIYKNDLFEKEKKEVLKFCKAHDIKLKEIGLEKAEIIQIPSRNKKDNEFER